MQSRAQPVIQQDSTDSLLDVPMLEALQRRHSDVKVNPASAGMRRSVSYRAVLNTTFDIDLFNSSACW